MDQAQVDQKIKVDRKKEERAARGRRMGKHAGRELSPEELQKLLKVG